MLYKAKKVKFYLLEFVFFFLPLILWLIFSNLFKTGIFNFNEDSSLKEFNFLIIAVFVITLVEYIYNIYSTIYIKGNKLEFRKNKIKGKTVDINKINEIIGGTVVLTFKYKDDEKNKIKKISVINQFGDKLEELIRELDKRNPNIKHDDIKYLKPWF